MIALRMRSLIRPGQILYASADHPDSVTEAREYIRESGLTAEDVRLIRKEGQVLVMAKRTPENWRK